MNPLKAPNKNPAAARHLGWRRKLPTLGLLAAICWLVAPGDGEGSAVDARDSRLFSLDKDHKLLGPATHLVPLMALDLVSVTVDQPQFWPDEVVRVRVAMPGLAANALKISWNKRDAAPHTVDATLDDAGLAVVQLADGKSRRLDLGEYRVEVAAVGTKAKGSTTFSVVEGTLGALSLAFPFERLTSPEQLEKVKAGWFLGNAAGVGQRWGNGLSFKNQLRVDNAPFSGEVEIIPRCMLSGCNGVVAGPRQKMQVKNGELAGTIEISGHSGPFQIEIITPQGSLRHQFEGSGHVEREMIPVSMGMRWQHLVGLAPYQGTEQLPGRALWAQRLPQPSDEDAFEIDSLVVTGGAVEVQVRTPVDKAAAIVWHANPKGGMVPQVVPIAASLAAGAKVRLPVSQAVSLVTIGGVAKSGPNKGKLVEGFVFAFAPPDLTVQLKAPAQARPNGEVAVELVATDRAGNPLAVSGILEAYDMRVAAKDPAGPLASAVGDSARAAGQHLRSWVDPVELERQRKEEERQAREAEKEERRQMRAQAARESAAKIKLMSDDAAPAAHGYGSGYGMGGASAAPKAAKAYGMGRAMGAPPPPGHGGAGDDDEAGGEAVRQGEIKVTFVAVVRTGPDGKATVQVPTPPQTGRLALRWTAVRDLGWTTAEGQLDLVRKASVEAQVPRALVAGGELELRVVTTNTQPTPLHLRMSGAGFSAPVERPVASGRQEHLIAWPAMPGSIHLALVDDRGATYDHRVLQIADVARQPVVWSRLEVAGTGRVPVKAAERAVVYGGPGALMAGIVSNVVTTMESWFPHAEALSAQVATRATLLVAINKGLLRDDGYRTQLLGGLDRAIAGLDALYDAPSHTMRPWAGIAPSPRWSAWVAANLQTARRALKQAPQVCAQGRDACTRLDNLAKNLDLGFAERHEKVSEVAGYDPAQDGLDVIEVEVDGQILFKAVTDDVVQRFVIERLTPALGELDGADPLALGKALDTFRFLRAFERVGKLQWLMGQAKAALLAGERGRPAFDKLFGIIARGMILSQEPGMLQGPAMLGGVYSQPMALPRFVELLLAMGARPIDAGKAEVAIGGAVQTVRMGEVIEFSQAGEIHAPRGALIRIDRSGIVDLRAASERRFAQVTVEHPSLSVGQQSVIQIDLDKDQDPLEFYALVAVPATVAIRQTEDALSDYKGQLIYGQQSMGSAKMQVIAVPFRGSRTLRLWVEGLMGGRAPGVVAIRHVHDPDRWCSVTIPDMAVRPSGAEPPPLQMRGGSGAGRGAPRLP